MNSITSWKSVQQWRTIRGGGGAQTPRVPENTCKTVVQVGKKVK